jgi:signal transduction histidine kinase
MRRHSFFLKLFLGNLLVVAVITAVSCAVSYTYLNDEYRARYTQHLGELCTVVQRHFQQHPEDLASDIQQEVRELMEGLPARLTVIAADGRVIADSQLDVRELPILRSDAYPDVQQAFAGEEGMSRSRTGEHGREQLFLSRPLEVDGRIVGVVRLATPVYTMVEDVSFIRNAVLWAALAAVSVAILLGLMISRIWYAPLRQIMNAARTIASGNLEHRVLVRGSDELAQLGSALNEMRQSLAGQIELIESQRENLAVVVANLREGVIAMDRQRRIVLMNRSALQMFEAAGTHVVGQHVQSVLRVSAVMDVINALEPDKSIEQQLELETPSGRLIVDLHATEVARARSGGIASLLVLHDITELARTSAMKAEFVANASHELRTPLATIRAAIDTMAAMGPEDAEAMIRFVSILDRHVKRLENMTVDLLDLHLVEQARRDLQLEDIPLGDLRQRLLSHFGEQVEEQGVNFRVELESPELLLRSDRRLVWMILQNLVENGIKFTPAGGEVCCSFAFDPEPNLLRVTVSDTGMGIPHDLQDRVFERFFQADPARDGGDRMRGTGLGLAIVRHAAERLDAAVSLKSRVGKGTTVTLTLPMGSRD